MLSIRDYRAITPIEVDQRGWGVGMGRESQRLGGARFCGRRDRVLEGWRPGLGGLPPKGGGGAVVEPGADVHLHEVPPFGVSVEHEEVTALGHFRVA